MFIGKLFLKHCMQPYQGVSDKWPKSKYQKFKSTKWFSYKIWNKNSEEPIVYLHCWLLPEQHDFLKIQWEIHLLTFLNTDQNAPKKCRREIWTFLFQICFRNKFLVKLKIRKYAYSRIICLKKKNFPLYFQKVMLLWKGSIMEIEFGFFRVLGPYFKG